MDYYDQDLSSSRRGDAVAAKREKMLEVKRRIETYDKHEVFEKSSITNDYYKTLKDKE